ncbi:annexin B9-like [Aphidius gifuensis]|uniref:annexin B9-like n=1 Tax=Aphidius gifuensis TaxID=684658 RepID=UPI001CDB97A7|nr:annexin B9-like [Aphidius gifuensis]
MNGYGYIIQCPQGPSGMPYPNQPGVYPHLTVPYPAQPTPYPHNLNPYLSHQAASYPSHQTAPYPSYQTTSYPSHQTAPYPSQTLQAQSSYPGAYPQQATSYPGQAMSQPLQQTSIRYQQAYQPQASYQEHFSASANPMAQPPPFNPMYTVQPTAPPACSQSNGEYNYAPPTNYHTSCQAAPLTTNTQIVLKLTPTVLHNPNFNACHDAEVLRKAMKGFGTDEEAIISILSNRNNQHRQHIANSFKALYGKDLIKDLKSELSGRFEDLIVAMMTPIIDYYVKEIHDSMSGIGTDEDVLITILCTLRNQDIHQICARYKNKYGKSLESDIRGDTSGYFERLLVSLSTGQRDESVHTDLNSARFDATRLYNAGVGRLGTDESEFNSILAQRNVHQLRLIFHEYSKLCGHDISTAIDREFSGHIKKALLTIVKCVKNSALYFAEQLNKSMSGIGTNDQKLIFICVTRSEVDMGDIKIAFHQKYGKTLEKRISEDTSGDYKKCLIQLISLNPRNY